MLLSTQTDHMCRVFGAEDGIRRLCEAGYDALDISLFHMNQDDAVENNNGYKAQAHRLKAIADSHGVAFRQCHAPFGGGYEFYTGTLIPRMPRAFEYAALLGVKTIVVHPIQRGPWEKYSGHEEDLFRMNMAFYRSLLPLAREYDVKIGIENMWMRSNHTGVIEDDVCADPRELCRYVDALDDTHVTVCLDLGHVGLCGREPEDAIRTVGHNRLGALHVHDVDYREDLHTLPGCGSYNWDRICQALKDVNYQGDFTYEADNFLRGFDPALADDAARFMVKVGRSLIAKIEGS